jgi:hypothetical protein
MANRRRVSFQLAGVAAESLFFTHPRHREDDCDEATGLMDCSASLAKTVSGAQS